MMANAWRICHAMGVTLHSKKDRHPQILPPKHTWARKTIKDVAEEGERAGDPEHIYNVLSLFMTSEVNKTQLHGECIYGVSRWALAARVTSADIAFIAPAFADVDLKVIRDLVHLYRIPHRPPQIALLVAGAMHEAMEAIGRAP